jgi:hypothetical protein
MNKIKRYRIFLVIILLFIFECTFMKKTLAEVVFSPSENISIIFFLKNNGSPNYFVKYKDETIIDTSSMGFDFKNLQSFDQGFKIIEVKKNGKNEIWEMPWGEQRKVIDNYNEMVIILQKKENPSNLLNIYFRAYDDGIGFRYEFPNQKEVDSIFIMNENTQFKLTGDHTCWWIPGDWDSYEHLYNTTKFSEIDAISKRDHKDLSATYIPENAVNTPITMKTKDGLYLSFHEANLTNYSGMTLKIDNNNLIMTSELVGSDRFEYKVKRKLPFKTPWRTIQICEKATDLIDSKLILNLNEPNKLGNIAWFKPMKYMGIWWEMHIGKSSWNLSSGKHGATTENAKRYIDFASKNNITGLLVEGWNTGWEHWIGFDNRESVFDFVTPYPDYDIEEVVRYGKEKGVEIIMHHETSSAPRTYEKQLDSAFALMKRLGINSVKTGYVGKIIPKGEYHHGQWMINHYRRVIKKAAVNKIAVDVHEPIKLTGLRRTYPNMISREGLRGQEFNAWASDGGNPPEHLSIIAFTRMLAGPIDFTPGVFDIKLDGDSKGNYNKKKNQINTTLAQQLALYIIIYSPIQMVCDLPENYENQPAFQFIRDVGVDWEKSKTLNGEIGDFVTIARQEKNTENWFLGSITDEEERTITIDFDFLDVDKEYDAIIYKDGKNAHWNNNPTDIDIEKIKINSTMKKTFKLAAGGGLAISLKIRK